MAYNAQSLDSFICYYLYLGFAKLYLYLDDPTDASVAVARRYPPERVTVRLRDSSLQDEWKALPSWPRLALYSQREVQARQMLNCEHAIARCRANGEQWLLHVDSDEMLFLPKALGGLRQAQGTSTAPPAPAAAAPAAAASAAPAPGSALQSHLQELGSLGAVLFTYRNLEAVPELLECPDPYVSVRLFKQHPAVLERDGSPSAARSRAMAYWTDVAEAGGELFRFYANGKSIVRVCDAITDVGSVHEWNLPSRECAATAAFTNHPGLGTSNLVYHKLMRVRELGGAVLLHFACCSFGTFWAKRWAALGYASPNHRFRGGGGGLDARANALSLGERKAEAEAFYRRSMMCDDAEEVARQLEAGVCVRVDAAELVEAARATFLPAAATRTTTTASGREQEAASSGGTALAPAAAVASRVASSASAPPMTATMPVAPNGLSAAAAAAAKATIARELNRALGAVSGDAVLADMARQAMDECAGLAHALTAEAVATASASANGARQLAARGLPLLPRASAGADTAGGRLGSDAYAQCFDALLPRALRATLQLLPLPRLAFDLAGYWTHPAAEEMLSHDDVATLLRTGAVVLPRAFPPDLVAGATVEAAAVAACGDGEGVAGGAPSGLTHVSTPRAHERSAWLLARDDAPARAPTPPPAGPVPPADLFGAGVAITQSAQPALLSALRGLRAIAAKLESISELRLALPRGALLREVREGGSEAHGPLNSGWPDSGCEVTCTLILGDDPARQTTPPTSVAVTAHGLRTVHACEPCSLVLSLARQAKVDILPSAARVLCLSLQMYSSQLRAAADGRMLGVDPEAARQLQEKLRGRSESELQEMLRQAGLRAPR